jgi:secondary thiamine-phosphate synthase enzyme
MTEAASFQIATTGEGDVVDLTPSIEGALRQTSVRDGIVCAFVEGSTAAITTIEFEPGLVEDLSRVTEEIAPRDALYAHEARWHDDNGHSHIRASLIGPSVCVPLLGGKLALGTWQQVVLCEFDTRPRERKVIVQIVGE